MYLVNRSHPRDMLRMRNAMTVVEDSFSSESEADYNQVYRLPIDVYSTENELVLTASVPGVEPDDVNITIEGDTLSISGELPV